MLIECENCGAPLDIRLEARIVKCNYCGKSSRVQSTRTVAEHTPRNWQPPPVWTPPPQFPAPSVPIRYHRRPSAALFLLPVVLVMMVGGVAAWLLIGTSTSSVSFDTSPGVPDVPVVTAKPLGKVAAWDGRSTLSCGMGETLDIDGKTADVDGTVIDASIGCTVRIKNSTLKGRTVVNAAINAKVEVEKSTLQAEHVVIDGAQASQIRIEKSSRLISDDAGIQMGQASRLALRDSTIEAKGVAIDLAMACKLSAEGASISGEQGSISAASSSEVSITGTTLRGKKKLASGVRVREY